MDYFFIIRILFFATLSFILAVLITPILTHFLYKYKCWKKKARELGPDGRPTPIFNQLHREREVKAPRMGGILIWAVTVFLTLLSFALYKLFPSILEPFNILNRRETWLPLFTLIASAIVGLIDDIFVIKGKGKYLGGGIRFRHRVFYVLLIGLIGALWFYFKLDWNSIYIPFVGHLSLGFWFIPFFIIVMLGIFSSGVVDGLDGLSAGVFATIFASYAVIAFVGGKFDLATFLAILVGAIIAYLWFNIPPARFYMGETGILALTTTLCTVAFLTNTVIVLPIISFILVIESLSVLIQLLSKKFRQGKKVFLIAPIHHHFEAKGWPHYKVTMRFWVISAIMATIGLIIILMDKTF